MSNYKMNKRLTKDRENGMVSGVCAGIAKYFNVDVTIVRIAFLLLPASISIYLIFMLVIPEN